MTVAELSSRITVAELEEWAAVSRVQREEQEKQARIRRVEAQARANRRL